MPTTWQGDLRSRLGAVLQDDPCTSFVSACLLRVIEPLTDRTVREPCNWDDVVQTAADEKVLSAMHDCLAGGEFTEQLPAAVAELFSTVKELNIQRNNHILSELKSICGLFNGAGIEPVVLKGAAHLLSGIYANSSARFLNDIDLLVPEAQFHTAVELLKQQGYFCQDAHPIETMIGNAYPPLWRPHSIEIDLHRSLGMGVCERLLPGSEVLSKSMLLDFEGVRLRLPAPEHLAIHNILHSQIHDLYRERIRPTLRSMYDLVLLQRRFGTQIVWAAIEDRFRSSGKYSALALYLRQIESTLAVASPLPIRMTAWIQLRWWRRSLLRRVPVLRFIDPVYLFVAGVKPRTPLREVLQAPGGWRYLLAKPFSRSLYARRLAGIR